jgi:predicted DNA-binding transcriptional regulator YafY
LSNIHRIHWTDAQIRAARYPNARTIAEHFEISYRQAARDIEYLRYTMGAPITYSAKHNGYYYADQTFALPALMMTSHDQENLSYLAAQYKTIGSENAARLANLFEQLIIHPHKTVDNDQPPELPVVLVDDPLAQTIGLLQKAVIERRQLLIRYMNNQNDVNERVFSPYKVFRKQSVDYVVGFCQLRQAIRVLRIDRIKRLSELATTFQVLPDFNEDAYGESMVFRTRRPYVARICFVGEIQSQLPADAEREGDNTYRIPFYDSKAFIAELLNHESLFRILAPDWLRERFLHRLEQLYRYNAEG